MVIFGNLIEIMSEHVLEVLSENSFVAFKVSKNVSHSGEKVEINSDINFLICEIVTFSVEQFRVEKFEQKCHWFGSENLKTFGFPMLYLKFYNVSFNVCRS